MYEDSTLLKFMYLWTGFADVQMLYLNSSCLLLMNRFLLIYRPILFYCVGHGVLLADIIMIAASN